MFHTYYCYFFYYYISFRVLLAAQRHGRAIMWMCRQERYASSSAILQNKVPAVYIRAAEIPVRIIILLYRIYHIISYCTGILYSIQRSTYCTIIPVLFFILYSTVHTQSTLYQQYSSTVYVLYTVYSVTASIRYYCCVKLLCTPSYTQYYSVLYTQQEK
jgi:hypothetical protein